MMKQDLFSKRVLPSTPEWLQNLSHIQKINLLLINIFYIQCKIQANLVDFLETVLPFVTYHLLQTLANIQFLDKIRFGSLRSITTLNLFYKQRLQAKILLTIEKLA